MVKLALLALSLTSCMALRGQYGYHGPYGRPPAIRMFYRSYPSFGSWYYQKYAEVDNPMRAWISVDVNCTFSEYWDIEIPPLTTQVFLLGMEDRACVMERWRFLYR
jgi:hypothetical protein